MIEPSFNQRVQPTAGVAGIKPYSVPRHPAPTDLKLDANEGQAPRAEYLAALAAVGPDLMRRYPDASLVQDRLARRFSIPRECVIVTAGGDDSLDRICRSVLGPGKELLTTDPSFEMLPRYAKLAGARVVEVLWPQGSFPTDEVIAAITPDTAMVAFVSPNNPTGAVGTAEDLRRLSEAAPHAILLCDFAYMEFAEEDLTAVALALPNVVMIRTLSKAFGLAGLRVGYALGPREVIGWMRAAGGPYAVARPSIALACLRLDGDNGSMTEFVQQVRADRSAIEAELVRIGASVSHSQGNFAFALLEDPIWLRDVLAALGIAIRAYPGHPRLGNALRVTCPGNAAECARLCHGIRSAYQPEALLVDFDSVLAQGAKAAPDVLARLSMRVPLGLVSRQPKAEVERFLEASRLARSFRAFAPVSGEREEDLTAAFREAQQQLQARTGWVVSCSEESIRAARAATLVPFGLELAGEQPELTHARLMAAGAARVHVDFDRILETMHALPTQVPV
jgi:histidinol-phosphate aminotransferase